MKFQLHAVTDDKFPDYDKLSIPELEVFLQILGLAEQRALQDIKERFAIREQEAIESFEIQMHEASGV